MKLNEFATHFEGVKQTGNNQYIALCPAHADKNPSLSIGYSDKSNRIVLHCFAGCSEEEILGKVLPDYVPDKKQTKSVSYFPFVSWFTLILAIITGVVLLQAIIPMLIFNVSSSVIAAVAFAVVVVGAIILAVKALSAALCYQNNGLAINNGKITAYYGGFIKNVTVFMSKNLIAAENVTTPLRKKAGITSLVIHLKTNALSNEVKVHIQEDKLAEEMEKLLVL